MGLYNFKLNRFILISSSFDCIHSIFECLLNTVPARTKAALDILVDLAKIKYIQCRKLRQWSEINQLLHIKYKISQSKTTKSKSGNMHESVTLNMPLNRPTDPVKALKVVQKPGSDQH